MTEGVFPYYEYLNSFLGKITVQDTPECILYDFKMSNDTFPQKTFLPNK